MLVCCYLACSVEFESICLREEEKHSCIGVLFFDSGGAMSDKTFEKRKKIIYDFICDDMYVPMKFKEMAMVLQVNKEQRDELRQVLESLEEEGKICLSKRGKVL